MKNFLVLDDYLRLAEKKAKRQMKIWQTLVLLVIMLILLLLPGNLLRAVLERTVKDPDQLDSLFSALSAGYIFLFITITFFLPFGRPSKKMISSSLEEVFRKYRLQYRFKLEDLQDNFLDIREAMEEAEKELKYFRSLVDKYHSLAQKRGDRKINIAPANITPAKEGG